MPDHPLQTFLEPANRVAPSNERLKKSLEAIRTHLGMEVAYISEFIGDQAVFREVDAPGLEAMMPDSAPRSMMARKL